MPSFRAWMLNAIFRATMKRHGDKPLDVAFARATAGTPVPAALKVPPDMKVETIGGPGGLSIDVADRAEPRQGEPATIVYYLHGGGYFFGSPRTHRQIVIALARVFGGPAYALDYRLAPEHPFPAALEDALATLIWLTARHRSARIVIAGDSAGGGLALATLSIARDEGWQLPAAYIGYSPWTDLAVTGDSVDTNAGRCVMFMPRGVREAAALYHGRHDPRDPRISPLYGDLKGLPPMLLFASTHEILRDDTLRLADKARAAGVDVELVVRENLPHVWPIFVRVTPEGGEALATVRSFAAERRLIAGETKRSGEVDMQPAGA